MNFKNRHRYLTLIALIVLVIFGTGCSCSQKAAPEAKTVPVAKAVTVDPAAELLTFAESIASIYPKSDVVMSEKHTIKECDDLTAVWFVRIKAKSPEIAEFYIQKLEADKWEVDYQAIGIGSANLELYKPGLILQIWLADAPVKGQTNMSIILDRAEPEKE
jgi:hypothetical protein